jgi:hypothetical protein
MVRKRGETGKKRDARRAEGWSTRLGALSGGVEDGEEGLGVAVQCVAQFGVEIEELREAARGDGVRV